MLNTSKHLKLVDAVGVALVLLAWMLNWQSVDKWNREERTLQRTKENMDAAIGAVQTTANVRLEAAVSRELGRARDDVPSERAQVYARAWNSGEVRERWLTVQVNSVWALRELMSSFISKNQELGLLGDDAILPRRKQLEDLYARLDRACGGRGIAPDNIPKIDAVGFPSSLADELETALLQGAAEPVFLTYVDLQDAIQRRAKRASLVYGGIFILGSILTVLARILGWRQDLVESRRVLGLTHR